MVDDKVLSFAGPRDMRVNIKDLCAAIKVKQPTDVCLGMVVCACEPTPKSYDRCCIHPELHGEFGSAIHTKSMALRPLFKEVEKDLVDMSHYSPKEDFW